MCCLRLLAPAVLSMTGSIFFSLFRHSLNTCITLKLPVTYKRKLRLRNFHSPRALSLNEKRHLSYSSHIPPSAFSATLLALFLFTSVAPLETSKNAPIAPPI